MKLKIVEKGASSSGHWGHAGIPGHWGGSLPSGTAMSRTSGRTAPERQAAARNSGGFRSGSMVDSGLVKAASARDVVNIFTVKEYWDAEKATNSMSPRRFLLGSGKDENDIIDGMYVGDYISKNIYKDWDDLTETQQDRIMNELLTNSTATYFNTEHWMNTDTAAYTIINHELNKYDNSSFGNSSVEALQNSYSVRSEVKKDIATNLQRQVEASGDQITDNDINKTVMGDTGYVTYGNLLHTWAQTSNDTHAGALSLQKAASQEFGVKLSKWQEDNIKSITDNYLGSFIDDVDNDIIGSMPRGKEKIF